MNSNELRAQMARHGDNNLSLAKAMDMDASSMSLKINGKRFFTQPEIQFIIDYYNLTADDVMLIFFTPQVSKMETENEETET